MWNSIPYESKCGTLYQTKQERSKHIRFLRTIKNIEPYGTLTEKCDNFYYFYLFIYFLLFFLITIFTILLFLTILLYLYILFSVRQL